MAVDTLGLLWALSRADDRFHSLIRGNGKLGEEVIGRRTPRLQHLERAHRRGQVLILRGASAVQRDATVEQVFEGPAVGEVPEEIVVRMGVGVDETGDHEAPARVDRLRVRRYLERGGDRRDPIAVNQNVGRLEARSVSCDDVPTTDDQRHSRPLFFALASGPVVWVSPS